MALGRRNPGVLLLASLAAAVAIRAGEPLAPLPEIVVMPFNRLPGAQATVEDRLAQFEPVVRQRLQHKFAAAGVAWPPRQIAFLAFKDVRRLQVYARETSAEGWQFVKEYRVLGASGTLGPKLLEGDRQVPEGIYRAHSLNPNSLFHLSIGINYPNDFDRDVARRDGREKLGSAIMIHGSSVSEGCLAVGDPAAEDLFVLAALAGVRNVRVLISPTDFRDADSRVPDIVAPWLQELYFGLRDELRHFPRRAAPVRR